MGILEPQGSMTSSRALRPFRAYTIL